MILDYFPILFPQFTQIHWGVYGISLGAHVALQCMAKDSRFECCVSMLGCPDYAQLMRHRLPPSLDLPPTLLHLLQHHDPIHHIPSFGSSSSVHRWVGLCMGRLDPCVPLSCVTSFIQSVNEHTRSLSSTTIEGTSRFHVWIDDVAKHTCTKPLVEGSLQTLKQWWKELEKRNPTPTE
ncbi:hypothetical protein HMI56_000774 [Coelomomyces lativittatus]|nr:hypothetical protein HMI56_000774 [Coelomomyces lativittatus]